MILSDGSINCSIKKNKNKVWLYSIKEEQFKHFSTEIRSLGINDRSDNELSSTNLAVDVVIFSKHQPASETRGEKGVRLQVFALEVLLKSLKAFICEHKAG